MYETATAQSEFHNGNKLYLPRAATAYRATASALSAAGTAGSLLASGKQTFCKNTEDRIYRTTATASALSAARIMSAVPSVSRRQATAVRGDYFLKLKREFIPPAKTGSALSVGGFTLIEIVISISIISIVLVTLLTVFNRTLVTSSQSEILTSAVMLANERVALIAIEPNLPIVQGEWLEDERYPRFRLRRTITETEFENVRLVVVEVKHGDSEIYKLEDYAIK